MLNFICNFFLAATFFSSFYLPANEPDKKLIGIIMPMQHQALDDIAKGFQEELATLANTQDYTVKVVNAQGDLSLQMALIKNLKSSHCAIFVPIGTATTQMTLQMVKEGSIVSLAAKLPKGVQQQENVTAITGVLDELSLDDQLGFLTALLPKLKKFAVVHSGSEKIHEELQQLKEYAKQHALTVQILMAQTMTDLATSAQSIDDDAQAIFVLKDHLIVSGITLLIKQAQVRKIPLVASDEGSVKSGAALALGVQESSIGRDGARLVSRIFNGASPKEIPISAVKDVQVFINFKACSEQGINPARVKQAADSLHYGISTCTEGK
jgi:putative tryptophan/tyrosine transport system substrate-binding protein